MVASPKPSRKVQGAVAMRAAEESRLPDCHGLDSTPARHESAVLSTISDLRCSGLRSMNFPSRFASRCMLFVTK